jgi:putative membrane protein
MTTDAGLEVVMMMFWNGGGWPFWEVALMWVGMIAFWGLLIWAVFALVTNATRAGGQGGRPGPPGPGDGDLRGDDPQRILGERLARGEIDIDEYRRLRDVLASGDARSAASGRTGR